MTICYSNLGHSPHKGLCPKLRLTHKIEIYKYKKLNRYEIFNISKYM